MDGITPLTVAIWIRQLMISFEFEGAEVLPEFRSIGLSIRLKEEVPEHLFLAMRFELLIPVIDMTRINDASERQKIIDEDRQYSKISFEVDDVLSHPGADARYLLRLVPIARDWKAVGDDAKLRDNRECFLDFCNDTVRLDHPQKKGAKLEWRNGFSRTRMYHVRQPEVRAHVRNPLYVTIPTGSLRDMLDRLPTSGSPEEAVDDTVAIAHLLAAAEDAFSDPSPPPPLSSLRRPRESFGYDTFVVENPIVAAEPAKAEETEEFDLDDALLDELLEKDEDAWVPLSAEEVADVERDLAEFGRRVEEFERSA